MAKKERGSWGGHALIDKEHETPLHLKAAVYEFQDGMSREEAEKRALQDYRNEHHGRAAAHHLAGMRASAAIGNHEAAERHHDFYSLHVKALGLDPMGPVPPEVSKYRDVKEDEKQKHVYDFKGHDADDFLVQPVQGGAPPPMPQAHPAPAPQPVQKSDNEWKVYDASPKDDHLDEVEAEMRQHNIDRATAVKRVSDRRRAPGGEWHVPPAKKSISDALQNLKKSVNEMQVLVDIEQRLEKLRTK